jgi:hypothetical protein
LVFNVLGRAERESNVEFPEDLIYSLRADGINQVERELNEEDDDQEV